MKTTTATAEAMRSLRMRLEELGREALHDRAEQEGGDEGQQRDEQDRRDQQRRRRSACRCASCPGRPGATRLPASEPATASASEHRQEAAREHRHAAEQVGERDAERAGVAGRWAARSPCSRRTPSRCCWPARRRRTASPRSPAGRRCRSTARRTSWRSPARSRRARAAARRACRCTTSLISRASIFLPRNSGVRPTIRPGDEHRRAGRTAASRRGRSRPRRR